MGEVKRKMNNSWPKNRATSRRSGQRRDVRGNVATLQSVELNDVATLQRVGLKTSRRSGQRRDVRGNVATFQRLIKIHVATLITHVATFQRVIKINVATL